MATQLITPHPNIPCTPGLCLVYVQGTFDVGPKYPTATAAWTASNHKHTDQNFPEGVWVPVWFSLQGNPDGHVALRQPDGSIWSASSPHFGVPIHHTSLAELERYYGNRLTYLGWTEDVEDVLIMSDAGSPRSSINSSGNLIYRVDAIPSVRGHSVAQQPVGNAAGILTSSDGSGVGATTLSTVAMESKRRKQASAAIQNIDGNAP